MIALRLRVPRMPCQKVLDAFPPSLVPNLHGLPLGKLVRYQPDLGLALVATAVSGVLWAVFRLGVAYTGKPGPA